MGIKEVTTDAGKKVEIYLPHEAPEDMRKKAIKAMDQSDERVVIDGLSTGSEAGAFLYAYKEGNKAVVGLSLPGIRQLHEEHFKQVPNYPEIIRGQHPNPDHILSDGTHSLVHVRAVKIVTKDGLAGWGEVGQPEYTKTREQGWWYNPHCVPIALSKAKRNAQKDIVPQKAAMGFLKKLIDLWVYEDEQGKIGKRRTARVLNAEQAKDPVVPNAARDAARKRLFWLGEQAGLDMKIEKNRDGLIKYVESYIGKKLSAQSVEDMVKAAAHLDYPGAFMTEESRAIWRQKVVGS